MVASTQLNLGPQSISVLVRGWCLTDELEPTVTELLGSHECGSATEAGDRAWRAQPSLAGAPLGPPFVLLAIKGPARTPLEFVPGSQGVGPPPDGLDHVIRTVAPGPDMWAIVDARCWVRFSAGDVAEATYCWTQPAPRTAR